MEPEGGLALSTIVLGPLCGTPGDNSFLPSALQALMPPAPAPAVTCLPVPVPWVREGAENDKNVEENVILSPLRRSSGPETLAEPHPRASAPPAFPSSGQASLTPSL